MVYIIMIESIFHPLLALNSSTDLSFTVALADLGGSSIVLKVRKNPPFCQENNRKWVWLGVPS